MSKVQLKNRKILVVDDEELIRDLFLEELVAAGAEVDFAENGKVALDKLRRTSFELILSDFRMPICNGLEMAKTIQSEFVRKPIIVICTGFAQDFTEESAKAAGIARIVEKPFSIPAITTLIAELLQASK